MHRSLFQLVQSAYYFTTGLWPLLHIHSFMLVTGYKTDLWLVKTLGLLIMAIAIVLWTNFIRGEKAASVALLGFLSATALMGVDIYYCSIKVISPIYLLDALLQLVFIIYWTVFYVRNNQLIH